MNSKKLSCGRKGDAARRGLLRVFVRLDAPIERQPFVLLAMVDEQNLSAVNDKNFGGKNQFFVDMAVHVDINALGTPPSDGSNVEMNAPAA
jgi:hypothetical protein